MGQQHTGNYYEALGVDTDATEGDIKSAYRKMVLLYHPDRSEAPDAVVVFTRIQKAYEVLSHPTLREDYDRQLELNAEVADHYYNVTSRYTRHLITMHVSATQVRVGEPFTIIFRCPRRVEAFKLRGLEHFEILKSVEHEMPYQGSLITQVHFVVRALDEGVHRLGPASGISGNVEFVSGEADIKVAGTYRTRTWANRPWISKYYPALLIAIVLFFPALIMYNIAVHGIRQPGGHPDDRVYPFGERKIRFDTGASPYPSATLPMDTNWAQVIVTNKRKDDVILVLLNVAGNVARNHYVRSGHKYTINRIETGSYHWLLVSGEDWDPFTPAGIKSTRGYFENGTTIGSERLNMPALKMWYKDKEAENTVFFSIYRFDFGGPQGEEAVAITPDTGFYIIN